jgi:hypothetical protein
MYPVFVTQYGYIPIEYRKQTDRLHLRNALHRIHIRFATDKSVFVISKETCQKQISSN